MEVPRFSKGPYFYRFISIPKTGQIYRFILISRRPFLPVCAKNLLRRAVRALITATLQYAAHTGLARDPTSDTRSAVMLSPHSSQRPHTSMQSLHAFIPLQQCSAKKQHLHAARSFSTGDCHGSPLQTFTVLRESCTGVQTFGTFYGNSVHEY